jgi:hypothetical protein
MKMNQEVFKNLKKGENKLNFEGIIKYRQLSVEKKSIVLQNNILNQQELTKKLNQQEITKKRMTIQKQNYSFKNDWNTMYNSPKKLTKNKSKIIQTNQNSSILNENTFSPKGFYQNN